MRYQLLYRHPEQFKNHRTMDAFGIFCMDGRFDDEFYALRKHLEKNGMDPEQIAGASLGFFAEEYGLPPAAAYSYFSAEFAEKYHGIKEVCIVDHEDCGAYKSVLAQKLGKDRAAVTQEEIKAEQETNLVRAQKMLADKFPNLKVRIFRAIINTEGYVEVYELSA